MDFYILAGSLASGKGTQARKLIQKYDTELAHISTGEIFRQKMQEQEEFAQEVKEKIDRGELVSDDLTNTVLKKELDDFIGRGQKAVLLDGYPRNEKQVHFLNNYLKQGNHTLKKVIFLDLEKDIVKKRVLGRFECSKCHASYNRFFKMPKQEGICDICGGKEFSKRVADTEETLEKRLKLYKETILKGLALYEKDGLGIHIDANQDPQMILKEIQEKAFSN